MNQSHTAFTLPVFVFFAQYPSFVYNPIISIYAQFDRLNRLLRWSKTQSAEARAQLHRAMAEQFNYTYGRDPDSLLAWRRLCLVLAIYPIPSDITECRKVSAYVTT
ncbi:hypothetical protein BN946_scf185043.g91 [Trametes cinnabarina]|uniref:Uncharacterized protein n=1 Tax=Pycnoporus cinnabarinus TaxID=5643 RepID=A0A060SIL4_PYCCI|nr:hypothetical protein BN946_scf185043.g91 [Trametes cinnabarina]